MTNPFLEFGFTSLNHYGEELCGDNVEYSFNNDWLTLVLADGLGSGVKANILSTLTSKILCTMMANDISIEDCVETIIQSLPVCKVRGVAYSTFSIIHINKDGNGVLLEFDNPQAICYRQGTCINLERTKLEIQGKDVYQSDLHLEENDFIIVMSDGTIHAGVGQILNFGWQRSHILEYINNTADKKMSARGVACLLASACNDLYLDKPGDDTTVAVVKLRKKMKVNVMIGPPVNKEQDGEYVRQFLSDCDKKVVCGGTSSQIVARETGKKLQVSFQFPDKDIPPIGFIDGINLVTEGVITIRRLLALSEKYMSIQDLSPKRNGKTDGASLLANILFEEATHIKFFVGQTVNVAHAGLPIDTTLKLKLVEKLSDNLRSMGKQVELQYD